jgi:hypothetical protein
LQGIIIEMQNGREAMRRLHRETTGENNQQWLYFAK